MQIKLIIWDLDDTLWAGTLAEGDRVRLNEFRADMVRKLNRCGIISAICSKNDPHKATEALAALGIYDEFVFPRIGFTPKAAELRRMIADMQLRPANVLFIDDNEHNLREALHEMPDIQVVHASLPDCDVLLARIYEENKHNTKSRVAEYRMLQAKTEGRETQSVSNEDFLRSCDIRAVLPPQMDNLEFCERIEELINRTNQLNYTQSRVEPGSMTATLIDVANLHIWSVFVWDRYGYYGLVGFAMVSRSTSTLIHFLFSCRVMHMGIEQFVLGKIRQTHAHLDLSRVKLDLPSMTPDWIKEESFGDSSVRANILAKETSRTKQEPALRIMCGCQSAGLAHFSRRRDLVHYDYWPQFFKLNMFLTNAYTSQDFPPLLVYGADIDYRDEAWPDSLLNKEIYQLCATRFCSFLEATGRQLFVILPPDNASEENYRVTVYTERAIFSRARAIELNSVWRECQKKSPNITVLDLSTVIGTQDIVDVSHYHAQTLEIIASHIDHWNESAMAARLQA